MMMMTFDYQQPGGIDDKDPLLVINYTWSNTDHKLVRLALVSLQ